MKALSSLIASSIVFGLAAAAPAAPPTKDSAPLTPNCRDIMFDLYGDLLFLQPNGSSLYYAAEAIPFDDSISVPAISPNWKICEIDPDYSPAFKIGSKVIFSQLNTNLELNWQRLYSSDKDSFTVPITKNMIGPISDIGPNSFAYYTAKGKVKFHFDSADLVFGQKCCVFERLYPNFFAGLSFARIKQCLRSDYASTAGTITRSIDTTSTFTGAGPQFGLDFEYRIAWDLFFTGTTAMGLVVGNSENSATYQSTAPYLAAHNIPEPNTQSTSIPDRTQLVPSLEEKIGLAYAGNFKCCRVELGAGYQTQVYINAVQTIDMTAPQVLPSLAPGSTVESGLFAVGFERTLSNFILSGPYVSLSVDF